MRYFKHITGIESKSKICDILLQISNERKKITKQKMIVECLQK